ncbi:hypothetical protein M409DRAFT_38092 [Zasmidium cellare ATCC 36951]|uniref:Beta-lactamase-related domain-containing protein n=1 Tax=Zasmidium cellare ATCC 36951 TaxID=1080233 RepID=A0A6A6BZ19_ZASCE|nr:uncharacterized protein M409DRAFT_38092 [Zasmidium cellare ATCC 36951]KAF2158779.1 hypothetical protein M409DRAFT_38092 [Zasmidium cellare ATCC 36951]
MDLLKSAEYRAHVHKLLERWHVPGVAIATLQDGEFYSAAVGKASLSPPKPCTPETLFNVASASKSLTAASVALLVEDERFPNVKYEALLSEVLAEDFEMPPGHPDLVTIEDMLSHRTGIAASDHALLNTDTPQSITRNVRNLPVAAPIRTTHIYCNQMYIVASFLVEKLTGQDFAGFLKQHFFDPLHMTSTTLQPSRARANGWSDRLAGAYTWDKSKQEYYEFESPDQSAEQGATGIVTCANDYIKWVKAMIDRESPISENVYKGLIKPRSLRDPDAGEDDLDPHTSFSAYAAGWHIAYYRGSKIVKHYGLTEGAASAVFFLPGERFGVVVFGNSDQAYHATHIIIRELVDEVLNVAAEERDYWRAKEEELEEAESESDLDSLDVDLKESLEMELEVYTGTYWNPGYGCVTLEVKDGKLFVDASNRSSAFTLTLEHIRRQTTFIAYLADYYRGEGDEIRAEFQIEKDRAVRFGLKLDGSIDQMIWFDKTQE